MTPEIGLAFLAGCVAGCVACLLFAVVKGMGSMKKDNVPSMSVVRRRCTDVGVRGGE